MGIRYHWISQSTTKKNILGYKKYLHIMKKRIILRLFIEKWFTRRMSRSVRKKGFLPILPSTVCEPWSGVKSWRGAFFLCGASSGALRTDGSKLMVCV
jgi:hypothetical protein